MGQDKKKKGSGSQRPSKDGEGGKDGNMGSALRSVYQQTVEEQIPDDLLDLLGKLN